MLRQVTDNLSVGNANDARLKGNQFDRVISLAAPPETSTHEYLIPDKEHDYTIFANAVDCIIDGLETEDTVLVHCQAGMSRSVSACIAAYVCHSGVSYETAYDECKHGFISPNSNLIESAQQYINENSDQYLPRYTND